MLAIISWDITTLLSNKPDGKFLKFYIIRNNPPQLTTSESIATSVKPPSETYIGTVIDTDAKRAYVADLQPVNNAFMYGIASVYADTAEEITADLYRTYFAAGRASAFRYLNVWFPQYTKAVCNSVTVSGTPPFMIAYNPYKNADGTPVPGKGGFCERPVFALGNVSSYADWYCNSNNGTSKQLNLNGDLFVWDASGNGQCRRVLPNRVPQVNYAEIRSKVTSALASSDWANGIAVTVQSRAGCDKNGVCPAINSSVNCYYDIEGTTASISDIELKSRLTAADDFGAMYVDGWQSQVDSTLIDAAVDSMFSSPAITNPSFYKDFKPTSADSTVGSLLRCAENNTCPPLTQNTAGGLKHSFQTSMRFFPDLSATYPGTTKTYGTVGKEIHCNNHGNYGYTFNSAGKSTGGQCVCDTNYYGSRCEFQRVIPKNCTGCAADDPGCLRGCPPQNCAMYNPGIPDMWGGYNVQKFIPDTVNGGCKLNPNPWGWADVLGSGCTHFGGGNFYQCRSGALPWGYPIPSGVNTYGGCSMPNSTLQSIVQNDTPLVSAYNGQPYNTSVITDVPDRYTLQNLRSPLVTVENERVYHAGPNAYATSNEADKNPYMRWVMLDQRDKCGRIAYIRESLKSPHWPIAVDPIDFNKL
jgi:hypothetical protein